MSNPSVHPAVQPWIIAPDVEQAFQATDATLAWLCDLPREILDQYAGRWVAARDCQILAAGETMEQLATQLTPLELHTVIIHRLERPGWTVRL